MNDTTIYTIVIVVGFLAVGIIGKRAGWFKIISGTNALLREQNIELRNQNTELKNEVYALREQLTAKHAESVAAIASLQGQIDVLKTVPLEKIDSTLQEIKQVLLTSAVQLQKDTKTAADAVKQVKSDLEH
jgi:hypothetical protein